MRSSRALNQKAQPAAFSVFGPGPAGTASPGRPLGPLHLLAVARLPYRHCFACRSRHGGRTIQPDGLPWVGRIEPQAQFCHVSYVQHLFAVSVPCTTQSSVLTISVTQIARPANFGEKNTPHCGA